MHVDAYGRIDAFAMSEWLKPHASSIKLAVIENVHSMTYIDRDGKKRGQGSAASFTFGMGFGIVIGVLAAQLVPMAFIEPAIWKLKLGLNRDKEASRKKASDLFPSDAWRWPLKKHDGRCEALLLAWFGERSFSAALSVSK